MHILIKFPTRSRVEKFFSTLQKWVELLSGKHQVRFLVTLDQDDATMNCDEVLARLQRFPDLVYQISDSRTKIQAINYGMENQEFDALIVASDDMIPQVAGYDDAVANDMSKFFPDLDGALHYDDGFQGPAVCTLSIMGINLYRKFGYIYYPKYKSLYCDNEFTEVVKRMGKHKYIPRVIIRHEQPGNVGTQRDALLEKNDSAINEDRRLFTFRKAMKFK